MTTWQPPIPAGALYSKSARALGPALALLAYCYDLVQRDGWVEIVLKDAAGDMEEPYQNVKRWWQVVRDGGFFCETIDRGRHGWRVRFKDVWLDWRILSTRPEAPNPSSTNEVPEVIPDDQAEVSKVDPENAQVQIKYKSSTNESPKMILQQIGNKEDMTDQDSDLAARKKRARTRPDEQEEPPEHRAYLERKKAIEAAYVEELGYTPAAFGREAKAAKWLAEQSYTPDQIVGCYRYLQKDEFYARQHISLEVVSKQIGAWLKLKKAPTNGHTPPVDKPKDILTQDELLRRVAARRGEHGPTSEH